MQSKAVLIIIAGPNGAGKTTITEQLLTHSWLDNTTYINPDIIAQEKFDGLDSKKSFIEAAKNRNKCIKNKKSLTFETVFSTIEKVEFVEKTIDAGFFC